MDLNHQDAESLKGKIVRIGNVGPESGLGRVLFVGSDYLVLLDDREQVTYYNIDHIKRLSYDAKDYSDMENQADNQTSSYFEADNFHHLLQMMMYHMVRVNGGSPECIQGVLSDTSSEDFITLIMNSEMSNIFTEHIKTISFVDDRSIVEQSDDSTNNKDGKRNHVDGQVESADASHNEKNHKENKTEQQPFTLNYRKQKDPRKRKQRNHTLKEQIRKSDGRIKSIAFKKIMNTTKGRVVKIKYKSQRKIKYLNVWLADFVTAGRN